jgi:predicted lysophospholipase L1 biosynthesis ABC-type transport system permease subunit
MRYHLTNRWFFSTPPWPLKLLSIYIWGDALIIVPIWVGLLITFSINQLIGTIAIGFFLIVRALGEMMYWFHQQFGARTYRPHDFGLTRLDNHAIYIIYQLLATAQAILAAILTLSIVLYLLHRT